MPDLNARLNGVVSIYADPENALPARVRAALHLAAEHGDNTLQESCWQADEIATALGLPKGSVYVRGDYIRIFMNGQNFWGRTPGEVADSLPGHDQGDDLVGFWYDLDLSTFRPFNFITRRDIDPETGARLPRRNGRSGGISKRPRQPRSDRGRSHNSPRYLRGWEATA